MNPSETLIVLAFAGVMASAVPALAQDAGQTGAGGSLTGSNAGTGGAMMGHSLHGHHHHMM
jgi:hypothetical protein